MKLRTKVFINKKTGQASITLPKKKMCKFFKKIPKELIIDIKEKKKW
jgi:hypothetical protein